MPRPAHALESVKHLYSINSGRSFLAGRGWQSFVKARRGTGAARTIMSSGRRQASACLVRVRIFVSSCGVEFERVDVSTNVGAGLGSESPIKSARFSWVHVNAAARDGGPCGEIARNETSFAKTKPGQVQNVSIHYKTVRVAEVARFAAVSPEATSAERKSAVQPLIVNVKAGGAAQAQPVSAAVADDDQPQKLAVVPRFAKADDEAGKAAPPFRLCKEGLVSRSTILKGAGFTCRTARRSKPIRELGRCGTTPLS